MTEKKKPTNIDPPIWFFKFLTNDWLHMDRRISKIEEVSKLNMKLLVGLVVGLISGVIALACLLVGG